MVDGPASIIHCTAERHIGCSPHRLALSPTGDRSIANGVALTQVT
jgi:hypothetical protein